MEDINYRKIFRDISRGYSEAKVIGRKAYLKHLSTYDHVDIDDVRQGFYDDALRRGVPTEEERLKELENEGQWGGEDEKKLKEIQRFIDALESQKKHEVLKSKIDQRNELIKEEKEKKAIKEYAKRILIGDTCETYADTLSQDHYILNGIYEDPQCKTPLFETGEYNNFDDAEVAAVIHDYNQIFSQFSETYIKKLVLSDFFFVYFPYAESTVDFFGVPACHLTYNQIQLMVFTRVFKNIFETNDKIPDHIRNDPDALIDYANAAEKVKERMQNMDESSATSYVGGTKEDMEMIKDQMGGGKMVDLKAEIEKKGGALDVYDLMRLG
jgi:hypothetical protein